MTSYKAQDFLGMVGLTRDDLPLVNAENFIDVAVGILNLYQAGLQEKMSGTEGNKKISADGSQWAAIVQVTNLVYIDLREDAGGDMDVEGLSMRARSLLVKQDTLQLIQSLLLQASP